MPGMLDLADPDAHPPVAVVSATHEQVSLDVAGIRVDFMVNRVGDVSYVDSTEGSVTLVELPRFPRARLARARGRIAGGPLARRRSAACSSCLVSGSPPVICCSPSKR